jgi:hypothetical protein
MKVSRKVFAMIAAPALLTLLATSNLAAPPELKSLSANARGQGTMTVGREVLKVYSVVVELNEDGTGELTIVTDLTLFISCTWSANADLSKGIDLKVTGGTTASGATGTGKLLLKPDAKSIASLSLQGSSNTEKRKIQLNFVAE